MHGEEAAACERQGGSGREEEGERAEEHAAQASRGPRAREAAPAFRGATPVARGSPPASTGYPGPVLTREDLEALRAARRLLERRGLLVTLTELLGKPLEKAIGLLPDSVAARVHGITRHALERALRVALTTLGGRRGEASADRRHRIAGAAAGALGGWFGLPGLALELPITTVLMLRSIADVARSEGHDLGDVAVQLACLEVFALGGPSRQDDAAETGYYAVRAALATALNDAARHVAAKGLTQEGAPALVQLLERIALRFGVVVEDKLLLEAVPILGAASGALINTVFMGHFQDLARAHFTVKRLEGRYGLETVRAAFEAGGEVPQLGS